MRKATTWRGFTIVELLVVLVIIGILAALLLPAVNSARESARRTQCLNNVRQIALAVINFEAQHQRFPPAAKIWPNPSGGSPQQIGHSLFSYLLPYFEEGNLFDQIDFTRHWQDDVTRNADGNTNHDLTHRVHLGGVTICPSSPEMRRQKFANGTIRNESAAQNQASDYAPVQSMNWSSEIGAPSVRLRDHGIIEMAAIRDLLDHEVRTEVRGTETTKPTWWGILRVQSGEHPVVVRAAHVRDGLSNTLLMFEAAGRPDHFAVGKPVPDDIMAAISNFRWGSPTLPVSISESCGGNLVNCHNSDELYAFHVGGATFGYADGSVDFHSADMDPEVFVTLFTMMGGDLASRAAL